MPPCGRSWRKMARRRPWDFIGIVGFYLLFDALAYFDFFGLVEMTFPDGARSPSEVLWRDWDPVSR